MAEITISLRRWFKLSSLLVNLKFAIGVVEYNDAFTDTDRAEMIGSRPAKVSVPTRLFVVEAAKDIVGAAFVIDVIMNEATVIDIGMESAVNRIDIQSNLS